MTDEGKHIVAESTRMDRFAVDAALEAFDGMRVLASLPLTPSVIESVQVSAEAIYEIFKALADQSNGEVLAGALKSYDQASSIALTTFPAECREIVTELTNAIHAICGLNK